MTHPSLHVPDLLADVLGHVCRHLDLEESASGLVLALDRWLPVTGIAFRRLDLERAHLETVAVSGLQAALGERTGLPGSRREELRAFAASGRSVVWNDRGETSLGRAIVPESVRGPVAAVPLGAPDGAYGVAVIGGDLLSWADVVQALVEPLTAAMENDLRIRELSRLRERAEADRRALLDRLSREDVADAVVGADTGLREVMTRVDQVAPTDAPVLVLGETGSGKEVVARALHNRSRRADGPFLRVNCGAIPAELVDSELFGHEKGSFTGAIAQRKGWFERSDGGTLFLDEVGELPAAAQVRLLRVLQDGTFERVGGQQIHTADVRIVAATHRDMGQLVRDGRFRQDLWYRIAVFPIRLPSLRERQADIPVLARHFAARAGTRLFGRPLVPTEAELAALRSWDWPGNVRELMAVIERAAILGDGECLAVDTALGVNDRSDRAERSEAAPDHDRAAIEAALQRCLGRIEGPFGAAAALGVNPHTLRSRMRRLGIDWSQFRRGAVTR
ncbi:MAG: sigma-54 dependent transcriptional regulator [Myxococcota bacterium]